MHIACLYNSTFSRSSCIPDVQQTSGQKDISSILIFELVKYVVIMLAIPAAGHFDYSDRLHFDLETLQRLLFLLQAAAARFLRE